MTQCHFLGLINFDIKQLLKNQLRPIMKHTNMGCVLAMLLFKWPWL